MHDSFDPYFEWLGIDNAGCTPDHYRLLDLERFESDPESVARAADAAMAQVRRVRPGPRLAEWGRLLDHLGAAKTCLLDPASKRAYDEGLREDRPSAPAEEPTAEPSPLLFEPVPIDKVSVASSSGMGPVITALLALAVVAGGGFVYTIYRRGTSVARNDVAKPQAVKQERVKPQAVEPKIVKPQTEEQEAAKPQAAEPQAAEPKTVEPKVEPPKPAPEQPKPAAVDAKRAAAFARAVGDARTALAKRNLAAAGKQLKTASANAQTQEDRDQVDRLQTMLDNLTQFWNGIRTSMAKLQVAEELVLDNTRIVVIESSRDWLKVKGEGRVQRFQPATLPTPLVLALADLNFGKDPGSRAIVGTFLAVDPHGNRAVARQYWQDAAQTGLDTEKLLPELDAPR